MNTTTPNPLNTDPNELCWGIETLMHGKWSKAPRYVVTKAHAEARAAELSAKFGTESRAVRLF